MVIPNAISIDRAAFFLALPSAVDPAPPTLSARPITPITAGSASPKLAAWDRAFNEKCFLAYHADLRYGCGYLQVPLAAVFATTHTIKYGT